MTETPHFQIGHMCAGCAVSNRLHTGCVANGNVVVMKNNQSKDFDNNPLVEQLPREFQKKIISTTSS
ncbi:hypothetical protein ISR94_01875 [Candidatus Microgenomates bacterium]|nr:hypothetical protein [Candidatus Microgenomates bacterium]